MIPLIVFSILALILALLQLAFGEKITGEMIFSLCVSPIVFSLIYWGFRWAAAQSTLLWAFRPPNHVIAIDDKPGHNVKILGAEEGKDRGEEKGIEWIGFPPNHLHEFAFVHERVDPRAKQKEDAETWIERDKDPKPAKFLLRTVTHWALVEKMTFEGGQQANILFQYQATVAGIEGAKYAIYRSEGRFFQNLNAVIHSSVISHDRMRKMTYDEFRAADKDEDSELMTTAPDSLVNAVNKTAATRSGYKLDSIFVYHFAPATPEDARLARLKREAEIKLEAAKLLAEASIADEKVLADMLREKFQGADPEVLVRALTEMSKTKSLAESKNIRAVGNSVVEVDGSDNPRHNKGQRRGK